LKKTKKIKKNQNNKDRPSVTLCFTQRLTLLEAAFAAGNPREGVALLGALFTDMAAVGEEPTPGDFDLPFRVCL
jgi:hypothetical protein